MTPAHMAALYAAAFPAGRAWSEAEIADLIAAPGGFVVTEGAGFAIGRAVAGEAELITLAVHPDARRRGLGRKVLDHFETTAKERQADTAFLEVAADNDAALTLYRAAGWSETGRRRRYYARVGGAAVDAIVMGKTLGSAKVGEPQNS